MSDRLTLDEAVQRLRTALDTFEAAVARRRSVDDTVGQLEEDVHLLSLDRARLAAELDRMSARAGELAAANDQAAKRLDGAMTTIRDILAANGG